MRSNACFRTVPVLYLAAVIETALPWHLKTARESAAAMIPGAVATTMNANQIIDRIQDRQEQLDAFCVRSLALFGSIARGEEHVDSDVDILVAFEGPVTFDQYIDLTLFLEDLLGRRADLVTEQGLREALRPTVERELRRVV